MKEVPQTEFSDEFVQLMRNRMMVSYFKYGSVADAFPHKVDAIKSLHQRLAEYAKTGNTEFLVDAANYAMIEFMRPRHAGAHFKATDSDASPGRTDVDGYRTHKSNAEIETLDDRKPRFPWEREG